MVQRLGRDRSEQKVIDDVAKFGWHCVHIQAEGEFVEYTFTVGLLQTYKHPELIIFGLPAMVSHQILTTAADAARSGAPLDLSQPTDELLEDYPCCFAKVPRAKYREHVGFARWYYEGDDFTLYQVIWPCRSGFYPWHPRATAEFKRAQPVIAVVGNSR
jgi:hypothetical protein